MASNSSRVGSAPVGLCGALRTTSLVLGSRSLARASMSNTSGRPPAAAARDRGAAQGPGNLDSDW